MGNTVTQKAYDTHKTAFKQRHWLCAQYREFSEEIKFDNMKSAKFMSTSEEYDTRTVKIMWFLAVITGLNWFFIVWFEGASYQENRHIGKTITAREPTEMILMPAPMEAVAVTLPVSVEAVTGTESIGVPKPVPVMLHKSTSTTD